jgi:ABC-type multidrug transport system fused ATPase/permease subunit
MAPIVDICAAVGLCLVMWFGAKSVRSGSLTTGDIVVFFAYVTNFFSPMRAMSRQAAAFAKAAAGADRVAEILVSNDEVREAPDAIEMPRSRGHIEFRNVSFEYERGQSVLDGLSLNIEAGEKVAILGTTGAGKSTLASLLLRLYDPREGNILVDGYDIRTLKLSSLRQQIGLVLQESLLFRGTLKENIAFGCPDADDRRIARAAKVAHVDEFASRLELGLNSTVDERGTSLSGGQRQRVAIARAILRDTPILVLDEPTCSLDNVSESIVLEALKSAADGRTTILITHRLTTARLADRIIVLEGGRIVEQGTFAELLDHGGRFALLASKETALTTAG